MKVKVRESKIRAKEGNIKCKTDLRETNITEKMSTSTRGHCEKRQLVKSPQCLENKTKTERAILNMWLKILKTNEQMTNV